MLENRTIRLGLLVLMGLGFLYGVAHLFILRFGTGDVYPAYSSLRADPLGTRAFFESLANLPRPIVVRRNYESLARAKFDRDTTLFFLGGRVFDAHAVSKDFLKVFDRLASQGGRVVMAFAPIAQKRVADAEKKCLKKKEEKNDGKTTRSGHPVVKSVKSFGHDPASGSPGDTQGRSEPPSLKKSAARKSNFITLRRHWGVDFGVAEHTGSKATKPFAGVARSLAANLPAAVTWHTALYFEHLADCWRVLYTCKSRPVIIARRVGLGSIVLAADSFLFSNEALRSERHPRLLAWFLGPNSTVVFDEFHFGIYKRPSVSNLVKRYHFQWFVAGLVLVALLFVWKNSTPLVPPSAAAAGATDENLVAERDHIAGLINLLRRNIPTRRVLQVCVRELEKSAPSDRRVNSRKIGQIKAISDVRQSQTKKAADPVRGYQAIRRILAEETHHE